MSSKHWCANITNRCANIEEFRLVQKYQIYNRPFLLQGSRQSEEGWDLMRIVVGGATICVDRAGSNRDADKGLKLSVTTDFRCWCTNCCWQHFGLVHSCLTLFPFGPGVLTCQPPRNSLPDTDNLQLVLQQYIIQQVFTACNTSDVPLENYTKPASSQL